MAQQPGDARIVELQAVDSTNAEALRTVAGGDAGPLWIRADRQEAGRGREGRPWISEPGNLYCSYMFPVALGNPAIPTLSLVAGLAVYDTVSAVLEGSAAHGGLCLKWPNDVLVDNAKISGILLETTVAGGQCGVAIGMGVNIAHHPEPENYRATCLNAHVERANLADVFSKLRAALGRRLDEWDEGRGFEAQSEVWLSRACGFGKEVTVTLADAETTGTFRGLDTSGGMIVQDRDGNTHVVMAGDVRFRMPFHRASEVDGHE